MFRTLSVALIALTALPTSASAAWYAGISPEETQCLRDEAVANLNSPGYGYGHDYWLEWEAESLLTEGASVCLRWDEFLSLPTEPTWCLEDEAAWAMGYPHPGYVMMDSREAEMDQVAFDLFVSDSTDCLRWWGGHFTTEDAIVDFANHPYLSTPELTQAIKRGYAADSRLLDYTANKAAAALFAHLDGADGVRGTADDNPFDDLEELYNVSGIGTKALLGIELTVKDDRDVRREGSALLDFIEFGSADTLRGAGLTSRQATEITLAKAYGPFYWQYQTIFGEGSSLDNVSYIGIRSIQKLANASN